jgi:hypothetical protein
MVRVYRAGNILEEAHAFSLTQREEILRVKEDAGVAEMDGGGGVETNKTTAKKRGPLPTYYLYVCFLRMFNYNVHDVFSSCLDKK